LSIRDELRRAKERRGIAPKDPSRICPACGKEAVAAIITEEHHEAGVVVLDTRPCEGCRKIAPGTRIEICSTNCWCEHDLEKAKAAPRVYLDECSDEEFELYASGAAKYSRSLQEERGGIDAGVHE